jgi:hypothetical protein
MPRPRRRFGLLVAVPLWLLLSTPDAAAEAADPAAAPALGASTLASRGAGRLWSAPPSADEAGGDRARQRHHRNLVNVAKLSIAVLATALLLWGAILRRSGRPEAHRSLRDGLLLGLGLASFFGWWNFLHFHYPAYLHKHEIFNYYIGSKYFPELGYRRLYECVAVADLESGLRKRVAQRRITNLETYQLEDTSAILAEPKRCKRHFSPARWALFKRDVGWFRSRMSVDAWDELQRDHGYNPTPAWGMLGATLGGSGPASTRRLVALTLFDPLIDLVMWGVVWWAFGWRAMCVALVYWGTNHPAEFSWIGGGYLRDGWLAAAVVGLCLLRRNHPVGAGFLLAYAALLRVFPALLFVGIGLEALAGMWRARSFRIVTAHRRLALGALLAAVTILPLSAFSAGGLRAWSDFAENMGIHVNTPGSNAMGLKTVLSYEPSARQVIVEARHEDPARVWKQARQEAFASRRPLFLGLALGFLALLAFAVRGQEDWVAAILGIGLIPVLLEPTCYYTSVLFVFGFLWTRREGIGVALCALSAVLWAIAAAWYEWDDVFLWSSVALLSFLVSATVLMLPRWRTASP